MNNNQNSAINLEKTIASLMQKIERHYYGKYRAIVVDNEDPEKLGRLKLKVPSVLGTEIVSGWAMSCMPYGGDANQGMLFIPEVDAGVWVEFEEGDLEFPIWVGTYWCKPGGESEVPKPNGIDGAEEGSVQDPPTKKMIKTQKGHTLQFEDKDGEESVLLHEATNQHVLAMNQDGIKVTDGTNGHELAMTSDGISVSDGVNSHAVTLDSGGISIEDGSNQHSIKLDSSGVSVETVSGAKIQITASGISVDGGAGMVEVKGSLIKLSSSAALPVIRATDQGIGNLGAPVVMAGPGNPTVLA